MTLQEKILTHARALPESRQREVWDFIRAIESHGRQPGRSAGSPSESAPSDALSVLDLALAHGVVGCVKDAPMDLSTNKEHMRGYGE
ncbi:MAG: hypothetical protein KJO08_08130 [Gammaproteobacteria bacterium]|nr:hypothetical protein [Gammaproteobacteria bacterium]NNJ83761.1 hypothetical protein [Gammaproteobacteria bacterium]